MQFIIDNEQVLHVGMHVRQTLTPLSRYPSLQVHEEFEETNYLKSTLEEQVTQVTFVLPLQVRQLK